MKVYARMNDDEFELFQKFRENADSLRFELSHKSARIVNDNLVNRAMEMSLSYQQTH